MLLNQFNLAFNLFLEADSDILHVQAMSLTEVSCKGVSAVALVYCNTLFPVPDANVDKEQRDTQFLVIEGGRWGKFASVYWFFVTLCY